MAVDPLGLDAVSETRACAIVGAGFAALAGGACAGGGTVTFGTTTLATPACVTGGAVAGCAVGITADRAANAFTDGISNAWNWLFSESSDIPQWTPESIYESHPTKAVEKEALSCNSYDCYELALSIDILVHQMKFRRWWDASRYPTQSTGYYNHKKYYNGTMKPTLAKLVRRAKSLGCPYTPEADMELKRGFSESTPAPPYSF